jgi:hypothetical protein
MTPADASSFLSLLRARVAEAEALVQACNKSSVLVIQQFPVAADRVPLAPHVRESLSNVLAFAELGDAATLRACLELADGVFDVILMDTDLKLPQSEELIRCAQANTRKSRLFFYNDNAVWAAAGLGIVQVIERGLFGKQVLLTGDGLLATQLALGLAQAGARVHRPADASAELRLNYTCVLRAADDSFPRAGAGFDFASLDLVIGGGVKTETFAVADCARLRDGVRLYDIGIGNFPEAVVAAARAKGCEMYRLDNRAGVSALVLGQLEAEYLVRHVMGKVQIKATEIVAGGILGRNGAIIVDNIKDPAHVIGVADGKGRVKYQPETEQERKDFAFVQRLTKKW